MASSAPKKTFFKNIFKSGSGSKKSNGVRNGKTEPESKVKKPPEAAHSTQHAASQTAHCNCCEKKINLRQSFRKITCHGCEKKVCKKCYVVHKLCHKCIIRQRTDFNNVRELLKIDNDKLLSILDQVHCDHARILQLQNNSESLIREILTICGMKIVLMEFEAALKTENTGVNRRQKTHQEQRLHHTNSDAPTKGKFIDLHRVSLPPSADSVDTIVVNDQRNSFTAAENSSIVNVAEETEPSMVQVPDHQHPMENLHPSPIQLLSFLPEDVIIEEDENEAEVEIVESSLAATETTLNYVKLEIKEDEEDEFKEVIEEAQTPLYVTPPLTPTRVVGKSQLDIFYSTTEIPQVEMKTTQSYSSSKGGIYTSSVASGYQAVFKNKIEHLTSVNGEEEIRKMTLFELKTILQKRGKPITGLLSYEDFVLRVLQVWEEEKQLEQQLQVLEMERQLEEEKQKMEADKLRLEKEEEARRAEILRKQLQDEMQLVENEIFDVEEEMKEEEELKFLVLQEVNEDLVNSIEAQILDASRIEDVEAEDKLTDERAWIEEVGKFTQQVEEELKESMTNQSLDEEMEQVAFEVMEVKMQLEELEEEWKQSTSQPKHTFKVTPIIPETVTFDESDEEDVASLPPAPPTPLRSEDFFDGNIMEEVIEEDCVAEDGKHNCTGYQADDLFT